LTFGVKEFSDLLAVSEMLVLNSCGPPVSEVKENLVCDSRRPTVAFRSSVIE
jgi:hypothetical protein